MGKKSKNRGSRGIDFDGLFSDALRFTQEGRLQEALFLFSIILKTHGNNHFVLSGYGNLLLCLEKHEDCLSVLERSLLLEPNQFQTLLNAGEAYRHIGKLQNALDCFDRALECEPLSAEAFFGRGIVLQELKRYVESVESLEAARKIDPSFTIE